MGRHVDLGADLYQRWWCMACTNTGRQNSCSGGWWIIPAKLHQ